jgi:hypothetical protein
MFSTITFFGTYNLVFLDTQIKINYIIVLVLKGVNALKLCCDKLEPY